jgi:hypothetical protein
MNFQPIYGGTDEVLVNEAMCRHIFALEEKVSVTSRLARDPIPTAIGMVLYLFSKTLHCCLCHKNSRSSGTWIGIFKYRQQVPLLYV